jgi:hypothetical protein
MHAFDVHRIFYGQKAELSNYQLRTYGSPRVRAISTADADVEKMQTAIVLALSFALDAPKRGFQRVYLFVPDHRNSWALAQIRTMAKGLTERIRSEMAANPDAKEQGQKILGALKEWLSHIQVGTTTWPPLAPEQWVAFGFTERDSIPTWAKQGLG